LTCPSGVAWRAAVDVDFDSSTEPMVRTLDEGIDKTQISEGILFVSLDANTETFLAKVDKKSSLNGYFEVRGTNADGRVIYDYRFDISCLGAIDPFGADPLPIASGGVSQDWVLAKLRAERELQFSVDGSTEWHETRIQADCYYRERYPEGEWTEAILIVNGNDGDDGLPAPNVKIQFAETASGTWHEAPTDADYYVRFSNNDATSWTEAALFHGADGADGGTGMTEEERTRLLPSSALVGQVPVYKGSVSGWIAETFNYDMSNCLTSSDIGVRIPTLTNGKIPSGQIPIIPSSLMSTIPSSIVSNLPISKIYDLQNQLNQKATSTNYYTRTEVDTRFTAVTGGSNANVPLSAFNAEMDTVYASITNLTNEVDSKLSKTTVYDMGLVSSQLTIDGKRGDYHTMEIASGSIVALGTNSFTNFSTGDSIVLEVLKPTDDSTFTYKGNIILGEADIGTYLFGVINNGKGYLVTAPTEIL